MTEMKKEFKNPSSKYRSAPFWSWNGVMNTEELQFQLRDFKEHGIGGAFAHPRVGMVTEYLSDDYFRAFKDCLDCVKAEDMKLYMYDENAWPSGFAGGKTARADKDAVSPIAKYRIVDAADPQFGGKVISAVEYKEGAAGKILTDIPKEEWKNHTDGQVMVVYSLRPFESSWTGGYAYVDIGRRETVETFMKLTHEEYKKRFSEDFGSYIPAIFSDEANFNCDGLNTAPYAPHVEAKFQELCGYPLGPNFPAVFKNLDDSMFDRPCEKVRYDYFYTLHELWMDNFVKPIAKWCEENNVAWTGHDIEHHWPQAHGGRPNPSEQTTYEFRQWPGLDLLLCDWLREEATNFDKYLMYEIRSAANQFGHERTLCEAYGAGGYLSTMYDYKRLGDFLLVGGINLICQHLSLFSYIGSRKRDCPQSFDYRQPWWNEYTKMADYVGRASYILSQGKMDQRILLINASTTGYLIPPEEADGMADHAALPTQVKNPDMSDYLTIVNLLTDGQWDFDIGDEYSIARNTKIEDGLFKFGKMAYETVVISKNTLNLRADTVKILLEFAAAGGRIITTDGERFTFAEYIDGEKGREETALIRAAVKTVESPEALCSLISDVHEARLTSTTKWPEGVQHIRRNLGDGKVAYFIVNHSMGTFETELSVKGDSIAKWDLYTGDAHGIKCTRENGYVKIPLKMERCASLLLVTGEDLPEEEALPVAVRQVSLEECGIKAECDNVITLDVCTLETKGETYPERYVLEHANTLFELNGFDGGSPWGHVQVDTENMDKNATFGPESAFKVYYKFNVDEAAVPTSIRAGVESPDLWDVYVNGNLIKANGCDPLDHDMGSYDIAEYVKAGENVIVLDAAKFNVLCEIEAIVLRGDFGVDKRDGKFVLTAPVEKMGYGDWADYKMPFYSSGVNYCYKATLHEDVKSAVLTLDKYEATIVSVTVNGIYAGFIGEEGGHSLEIGKYMKAGENDITVRVAGSLRNVLGPHHGFNKYIPYDWSMYERGHVPTADEYAFSEYGLWTKPTLKVN